ncbi:MAG: Xaa-Pro peptidase family protein [Armatimonadetes bacterium]|nr:Xaa-Pro peptidase family protein [Armatimonadota bacterium]
MHRTRLERTRCAMASADVDALLVTRMPNIFYLSGFTGSTAGIIVTSNDCYILVDPRYSIQARTECTHAHVIDYAGVSLMKAAADLINDLRPKHLGFESEHLTVSNLRELRRCVNRETRLRSTHRLIEKLRQVKDAHEIGLIRRACEIADHAFESVLSEIKPGMTEKDVATLVDFTLRRLGADKEAFETIVACGPNSACPHATPSNTVLEPGQLVKLDFGARYLGYNSDLTRTICLGEPDEMEIEIHRVVLEAQQAAIEAIKPGKSGQVIDRIAREHIASQGYGDNFSHGLGHQLGIETHDGPGLSQKSDLVLQPGNVLTVEPGIYIEGWGGLRIEDDVLVTDTGAEILTSSPRNL